MPPTADPPLYPPIDRAEAAAQNAEYHRLVLRQMIDVGMTLIHAVGQAASARATAVFTGDAGTDGGPLPELAIAYERVARSVRRSIALTERLETPAATPRNNRTAARTQIIREVEDAIERLPDPEPGAAAALRAELSERLDSPDLDDDLADRPVADIIADIVRDLGLAPQHPAPQYTAPQRTGVFKRRTPADIRALREQASRPAPFPVLPDPGRHDPASPALTLGAAHILLQTASSPG